MKIFQKSGLLVILCFIMILSSGCSNANKIADLENEILKIEEEISNLEYDLNEWKDFYDKAESTYNQYRYSTNSDIQKELESTKEMMDEAGEKIRDLKTRIALLESQKINMKNN